MSQNTPIQRRGRNPNYDLQRHIANGESGPFNSESLGNYIDDANVNYDDPSEFGGSAQTFEGDSDGTKDTENKAQAFNLDSGYRCDINGVNTWTGMPVDPFNRNDDHGPNRGGPNNTGGPMNTDGR